MTEAIRTFDAAVRVYLTEQTAIGLSEETVENYSGRLRRFRNFWAATEPEEDPTPENIREYRDKLTEEGLSKTSVRQYLVELKGFFEFVSDPDFGFYEKNPVSKRMFPKLTNADDRIYDKILDAEDLKLLWKNECPKVKTYTKTQWARNYAIVTLLLDGKIRNGELLNLKLADIDFEYNEIYISKGKGSKTRWVTVSDITITAIKLYLNSGIRPDYCTDDDFLFGTTAEHEYGKGSRKTEWHQGTRQWLSQLVEKHVAAVTGKKGFKTHSLRHNGSILDLNTGVRTERLQAELGHSSITTTEIYSGRLQSVRRTREYHEVAKVRDECAAENMEKLQKLA